MLLVSNNKNNVTYRNTVDLEAVKKVSVGNSSSHSGKVWRALYFSELAICGYMQ